MKYEWLDEYLLSKPGAVRDFKEEWNATRYMINGKMFCMVGGDKYEKPIITLKCLPEFGLSLREQFSEIIPGHYMNKVHWNSVYRDGNVPDDILKKMADMSYELIFLSLSKKAQAEIKEG